MKTSMVKKVTSIPKSEKKRKSPVSVDIKSLNHIFEGHKELLEKLRKEAKKNFRTPKEQLVYYTWKCIEFMEDE